ncbi:MAG: hypothetical protein ACRD9W_09750 [Terriglobia bacterium]
MKDGYYWAWIGGSFEPIQISGRDVWIIGRDYTSTLEQLKIGHYDLWPLHPPTLTPEEESRLTKYESSIMTAPQ